MSWEPKTLPPVPVEAMTGFVYCECCADGEERTLDPIFGTWIHSGRGIHSREMIQCPFQDRKTNDPS